MFIVIKKPHFWIAFYWTNAYTEARNMVNVAQLVEHQIVALGVVGSIPTIHPIK